MPKTVAEMEVEALELGRELKDRYPGWGFVIVLGRLEKSTDPAVPDTTYLASVDRGSAIGLLATAAEAIVRNDPSPPSGAIKAARRLRQWFGQ